MRALICTALSDDLSGVALGEAPAPQPQAGEALVQVKAASVNFPDALMCQGKYQFKPPPPFIPGIDFAGIVEATAPDVDAFKPGDAVMGGARLGGFAALVVAPAAGMDLIPAGWSFAQAAAYQAGALTAYVALKRRGMLEAGETLLVHGAAGGMGLAAARLGQVLGARVLVTASTPAKQAFLRERGFDEVLPAVGFRDQALALTEGRGVDVVFDPVGGDVFDESVRVMGFDGRLLVIGFTSGRIASVSANLPLIKGFSVVGVRAGEYGRRFPERGRENRAAILALAQDPRMRPHIQAERPLSEGVAAMQMLLNRQATGKIVLRPDL